jgi:alpha-1,6-mannosyltransferase
MNKTQKILFTDTIILYTAAIILCIILSGKPIVIYTVSYISASIIFIILCIQILKNNLSSEYIFGLLALSIVLRIALIGVHPTGSDDYYRYLWDGKVLAHGINPYKYAPIDTALSSLHTENLPSKINHPEMKTIYPPVSQFLFYFSYLIGGESAVGLKLLLLFFDLASILGLYLILKRLKIPSKYILLYSLCTLPLFQFFIDAHVDGFGLTFLVFAIYFYLDKKNFISFLLLGLSLCVKPTGLIIIPVIFFNEKTLKEKIKSVAIPLVVCLILYFPFIFSGNPFSSFITFTENWTFNGIVFDILDSFIHDNQITRLICGFLLLIPYVPLILSKKDFLVKIYIAVFLLMIFSPVVHPWYLCWLAILLPIIPRWSGITYVSLISLTTVTVLNYQLNGVWQEYTWVLILEYVPVISIFIYEVFEKKGLQIAEENF